MILARFFPTIPQNYKVVYAIVLDRAPLQVRAKGPSASLLIIVRARRWQWERLIV